LTARLIIFGRQGAGKGTQASRLADHLGVPHISTGDMLRAAERDGTAFGRRAKEYMDRGELLPDEVMIGIVRDRLQMADAADGYILDGFPRTGPQAEALDDIAADRPIDVALHLDVPVEVVVARISSRRVCSNCAAVYSTQAPPSSDWTCDVCGGEVVHRDDDTEDAVRRRLSIYDEETRPVLGFYERAGRLVTVDGVGDPDEVFDRLAAAIDARIGERDAKGS
jgi:adenylate kinase